ncbi:MAG: tRNA methyl transferase PRC-barrel domain-containing protein, partial [Anaerovorax sp.]
YLATGHYAQVAFSEDTHHYFIKKAESKKKDQSYMLYALGQDILSRLLLPLGTKQDKEEVRSFLRKKGLSNAELKDSQEICFIKDGNYVEFIKDWNLKNPNGNPYAKNSEPGKFVDKNGTVLGIHQGIVNYTIGQRKGLGITFGKPVFVTHMNPDANTVTLGDQEELFSKDVVSTDHLFVEDLSNYKGKVITAKIRYASIPAEATIEVGLDGKLITHFKEPQRAATPGQSIVFYDGDLLIGGGVIL